MKTPGRKRPIHIGFGAVALFFTLWIAFAIASTRWPTLFCWREIREANRVIVAVNAFQTRYGRLPETLAEAGIDESASLDVYYRKDGDSQYLVRFGTVLGESATCESSTKEWR